MYCSRFQATQYIKYGLVNNMQRYKAKTVNTNGYEQHPGTSTRTQETHCLVKPFLIENVALL